MLQLLKKKKPIHYACGTGNIEIIKYLYEKGSSLECDDLKKNKPLHFACENNNIDAIKFLFDKNVKLDCANFNRMYPIHYLSMNMNVFGIKHLIKNGINIERTDVNGNKPIHYVSESKSKSNPNPNPNDEIDILQMFCEQNVNLECVNLEKNKPIHLACKNGKFHIVKFLCDKGVSIKCAGSNGNTPLHMALESENNELIKFLIDLRVDLNCANSNGDTPILIASKKGNFEIVNYLIGKNVELNCSNKSGYNPLHYACEIENFDMIKLLVDNNVNMNTVNQNGNTPFIILCKKEIFHAIDNKTIKKVICPDSINRDNLDIIKKAIYYMIDKNIDVLNCVDSNGMKPLDIISKHNEFEIFQHMLTKNPNLNLDLFDKKNKSPLYWMYYNINVDGLKFIFGRMESTKLTQIVDKDNMYTPFELILDLCVNNKIEYKEYVDIMKCLIDNNIDIDHIYERVNVNYIRCSNLLRKYRGNIYPLQKFNLISYAVIIKDCELFKYIIEKYVKNGKKIDSLYINNLCDETNLRYNIILSNDSEMIKCALENGIKMIDIDINGLNAYEYLVKNNFSKNIKFIIDNFHECGMNDLDLHAFIFAICKYKQSSSFDNLKYIDEKIGFTSRNLDENIMNTLCQFDIFKYLIDKQVFTETNLSEIPTTKSKSFDALLQNNDLYTFNWFLTKMPNLTVFNDYGNFVSKYGSNDSVNYLIHYKCKSFHYLCEYGDFRGIKSFIDNMCDLNEQDIYGNSPIHYVCKRKNNAEGILNYMRESLPNGKKINFECENKLKQRPIHHVCLYNNYALFAYFIRLNVNLECEDIYGMKPVDYIFSNCSFEFIKNFLSGRISSHHYPKNINHLMLNNPILKSEDVQKLIAYI